MPQRPHHFKLLRATMCKKPCHHSLQSAVSPKCLTLTKNGPLFCDDLSQKLICYLGTCMCTQPPARFFEFISNRSRVNTSERLQQGTKIESKLSIEHVPDLRLSKFKLSRAPESLRDLLDFSNWKFIFRPNRRPFCV